MDDPGDEGTDIIAECLALNEVLRQYLLRPHEFSNIYNDLDDRNYETIFECAVLNVNQCVVEKFNVLYSTIPYSMTQGDP